MKHQWEKSQRGARGGAQETLTARKPRKEKEAPIIAANTVGKQDSTPWMQLPRSGRTHDTVLIRIGDVDMHV